VIVDRLLSHRLVFLSGKGGVGKSTVGAALAVTASRRGKRVLLVEVEAPIEAARILGKAPVGERETEVRPNLFTVNLSPQAVMDEYVRLTVKVDLLARKILQSPVYHRFFAAAPGLPELMVLGKIMSLEEAKDGWSRRPRYDLIVVDAPATGHGLAFLKVPFAASQAIPVGPIGTNARRMIALLRDTRRTALGIVAIPEEMAVVEAIEFHRMMTQDVGMKPAAVFLNACHEARFTSAQETEVLRLAKAGRGGRLARGVPLGEALAAARRHIRRRKLTRFYEARLRKAIPAPTVPLPYLFREALDADSLETLARRLEAS